MSEIKVNKLTPRTNCGTVQLGDSGDTITIPSGATITNNGTAAGFGATGAVSWDTTVKTSGFTAVSGIGYFVNTTSGAITVTLPASPSAGAVVGVSDYAGTSSSNNITIGRNGSNINGAAEDLVISFANAAATLVYVDGTQGWKATDTSNTGDLFLTPTYISASGGTETTIGDFKVHAFTSPGTFTVSSVGNSAGGGENIETMIVAGGGGAGFDRAGGAGAGGMVLTPTCGIPISAQAYPIAIGGGGAGIPSSLGPGAHAGCNGTNSTGFSLAAIGGGGTSRGGNARPVAEVTGEPGGSGGGGGAGCGAIGPGGPATQPTQAGNSGSFGKGFAGGNASPAGSQTGGGGGAGGVGVNAVSNTSSGPGGPGFDVSPRFGTAPQPFYQANNPANGPSAGGIFAGGGGGGASGPAGPSSGGSGGPGGGGFGGNSPINTGNATGKNGLTNTGGGGGGSSNVSPSPYSGGNGGSGIVLIRYKFQN